MEDLVRLVVQQRGGERVLVELSGEFDVRHSRVLGAALSGVLGLGRRAFVDLSGVTFLDELCVRELAVLHQLYGNRLMLCDPSPEARLSVAACDLEDCVEFGSATVDACRSATGGTPCRSPRSERCRRATENRRGSPKL